MGDFLQEFFDALGYYSTDKALIPYFCYALE